MRFQAHGFIECPGSGIAFPNVKSDIMAAILFRKSPAVIVYEYGSLDDLSWNKQRREFFHSLHYPDPRRAMEVPVAP